MKKIFTFDQYCTSSSALELTTQSNKAVFGNTSNDEYHFSGTATTLIDSISTILNGNTLFQLQD